jgi:hypothetical protein
MRMNPVVMPEALADVAQRIPARGRVGVAAQWQQELQHARSVGWFRRADAIGESARSAMQSPQQDHAGDADHQPAMLHGQGRVPSNLVQQAPGRVHASTDIPSKGCDRSGNGAATEAANTSCEPAPPFKTEPGDPLPACAFGTRIARSTSATQAAAAPARIALVARDTPAAGIRIHIEQQGEQAQAWLGVPGDPQARAARTGEALRLVQQQLALAGLRLASFTCNGKLLYQQRKEP